MHDSVLRTPGANKLDADSNDVMGPLRVAGVHLGPLLGSSWSSLDPSWGHLDPSWSSFWGHLGATLVHLGSHLGAQK